MKILIIGEFSAFSSHLKNGFQQLGHDVTIVHTGDGWLKLGGTDDIIYNNKHCYFKGHRIKGTLFLNGILSNLKVDRVLQKRFSRVDLVIVVNYGFIRKNIFHRGVKMGFLKSLINKKTPLLMMECGNGPAVGYYDPDFYDLVKTKVDLNDKRYSFLLTKSKLIIPTTYGYYAGLKKFANYYPYNTNKISQAIPLPMTVDSSCNINTCKGRKIVVFHGINRPVAKGTPFIQEAMERLQNEFPDKVECICKGHMPYSEYVQLFDSIDILIDQTYGNGWGMNAEIGAMKGKCVLTPCGPENGTNMRIDNIPFVQIGPDSEQIYQVLKDLVLNPDKVDKLKKEARAFVEQHCDCRIVAQRYLDALGL